MSSKAKHTLGFILALAVGFAPGIMDALDGKPLTAKSIVASVVSVLIASVLNGQLVAVVGRFFPDVARAVKGGIVPEDGSSTGAPGTRVTYFPRDMEVTGPPARLVPLTSEDRTEAPTPVDGTSIRPPSKGSVELRALIVMAAIGIAVCLAILWAFPAQAEQRWKHGPAATLAVGALNLKTGGYMAGVDAVPLGACYGVTYLPIKSGADLCFNVTVAKDKPNRVFPSVMIHAFDYFNVGAGVMGEQGSSGMFWQWLLLLGGRLPVWQ